ncbi:hypothetical protein F7734_34740 [Scytonema sp. UIC 10036]|nr:hypothetical protein [Scytonema sp. UIC 10036]MUG97214.1 hypothetical protein [Scytonema sp. UIC 10036]
MYLLLHKPTFLQRGWIYWRSPYARHLKRRESAGDFYQHLCYKRLG